MTMNDQTTVVAAVAQKRHSDPQHLLLVLLVERLTRIDAGMNKKTPTVIEEQSERTHPIKMGARQIADVLHAVALQCLCSAIAQPRFQLRRAIEQRQRPRLVISFERDYLFGQIRLQTHHEAQD